MATFTIFIMTWVATRGINETHHCFTSDILTTYLLPSLDANTLIHMALCINKKWSISAIRILASRTKFLSIKQTEMVLNRISSMHSNDLSSERAMITNCFARRFNAISQYNKHTDAPSLRLRSKSDFYLFKIGQQIKISQYCSISIEALIMGQNENTTSVKSSRLTIRYDPIIQTNGDKVILFASYNGIDYFRCIEVQFDTNSDQEILYYDVRINLSMMHFFYGHYSVASHSAFLMDQYEIAAPVKDVYLVEKAWNISDAEFWIKTGGSRFDTERLCGPCTVL